MSDWKKSKLSGVKFAQDESTGCIFLEKKRASLSWSLIVNLSLNLMAQKGTGFVESLNFQKEYAIYFTHQVNQWPFNGHHTRNWGLSYSRSK